MSNEAKTIPAAYSEDEQAFEAELKAFFGGKWGQNYRPTVEMPAAKLEGLRAACVEVEGLT